MYKIILIAIALVTLFTTAFRYFNSKKVEQEVKLAENVMHIIENQNLKATNEFAEMLNKKLKRIHNEEQEPTKSNQQNYQDVRNWIVNHDKWLLQQ